MAGAAKAWVAALASFLTALLTEWTNQVDDKVTLRDLFVAFLAAVVTFSAVYYTTNKPTA